MHFKTSNGYSYSFNAPRFNNQYNYKSIVSLNYPSVSSNGASSSKSFTNSILGSIGEAYERQALQLYNPKLNNKIKVINVLNSKKLIVDSKKYYKYFFDTCGLSTYTNTAKCLENSFSEFVERQSFLLSYLSKSNSKIIVKNSYFLSIIPKEFLFLNFYEISMIKNYRVVFCIGQRHVDTIDIGMGAGYTIKEALNNSIKEIMPLNNYKHPKVISDYSNNNKADYLDYLDYFNMLPANMIMNAYEYLNNNNFYYPKEEKKCKLIDVAKALSNKYGMDIYMCSLLNKYGMYYRNHYAKNIKVLSLGWFPSLKISDFDENIYLNIEKKTGLKLDRDINFIPFP